MRLTFERFEGRVLMATDFWHRSLPESGLGAPGPSFTLDSPVAVGELICFQYAFDDEMEFADSKKMAASESESSMLAMSIVVDHLVDENDGDHSAGNLSLREAIEMTNANPGADEISFAPELTGGTIALTIGELSVTDDVRITGLGRDLLTISGADNFRVFNIATSSSILEELTISNGRTTAPVQFGGGIRNSGNLQLINAAVMNNHTVGVAADGGGIFQLGGQLTIVNSVVSNNGVGGNSALGGGIGTLSSQVTITDSLISENQTTGGRAGGAGVSVVQGILNMVRTSVIGNENLGASSEAAGVLASASFQLVDSSVTGNRTVGRAGGVLLSDAGIAPGLILNSTISGNMAQTGYGGGVAVDGGRLTIEHSTISENTATSGGGDGVASRFDVDFPSSVMVRSSIIAGNGSSDVHEVIDGQTTIDSDGFNLIGLGNATGAFDKISDQVNVVDPGLAPLGNHGGSTQTHPLLPESPAIDAGDASLNAGVTAPLNDQRGLDRIFGSAIDIGAYESLGFDYGDAPPDYPTLLVDQGASHEATGVQLGNLRDVESDGQPSAFALGDGDDEDGVVFGSIIVDDVVAEIQVNVVGASEALVSAWIDWDRDGEWQQNEQVLTDDPVASGTQLLTYTVPPMAIAGNAVARVRISSIAGLTSQGHAIDGEVEDYLVEVQRRPRVEQVLIADGTDQRSMVTELTVQFDSEVTAPMAAFELRNRDTDQSLTSFSVESTTIDSKTESRIVFEQGPLTFPLTNGSFTLVNGNYELVIRSSQVIHAVGGLAMANDFVFGAQQADDFFRLFGDSDGDRDVDGLDLGAFGQAFLTQEGQPRYQDHLDSDGDGDIDGLDLGAFGQSFLQTI